MPVLLRPLMGICIDSKIISRKSLAIWSNLFMAIIALSFYIGIVDGPKSLLVTSMSYQFVLQVLDTVTQSIVIEQSRGAPKGNEDMQSFKFMFIAIMVCFGSIFGTVVISYKQARLTFLLRGIFNILGFIQAMFLSPDLETNERANFKNEEILLFEEKHREMLRNCGVPES